tara:strand:- start:1593 stop:1772 length:180 start_codon:yes stop_codon:yes gene_type:complete
MLAIESWVSAPSSAKALDCRCSSFRNSGKLAITRPTKEMSQISASISAASVNALMMRKE